MTYSREELAAAHDHLIALSMAAQGSGQWDEYCELFTEDALYVEHFLGTYHGRDEIKQWLIPAMTAWPQMRFPVQWRTFNEEDGLVVFAVGNDMPDVDGTGPTRCRRGPFLNMRVTTSGYVKRTSTTLTPCSRC